MPGVPPTTLSPCWDAFCMSLPMQIKPGRDEQLFACHEGSAAGSRVKGGLPGALLELQIAARTQRWRVVGDLPSPPERKGCFYTKSGNGKEQPGGAGRLPPLKASDAPCAAQNLPGKPDRGCFLVFFWLCFSTCSDAQVFLITPDQKTFLYRSIMF